MLTQTLDLEAVLTALSAQITFEQGLFWLDAGADAREGWSYLGYGTVTSDTAALRSTPITPDATAHPASPPVPPFSGGWVGWLSYEHGAQRAGAPVHIDETTLPEAWIAVSRAVAYDHESGGVWALAAESDLDAWQNALRAMSTESVEISEQAVGEASAMTPLPHAAQVTARHSVGEYTTLVEQCRQAIRAGDAYQLCLTTRFSLPFTGDPIAAYLRLRRANPAHHGGFVRVDQHALLSASPEQFLSAADGRVGTKPIKGTRPRGATAEQDASLARELFESEKERAENVMIVDLMRNDLSRVSTPGTIRVDALWHLSLIHI